MPFYEPMIRRCFDSPESLDNVIEELRRGQCEFWTAKYGRDILGHFVTRFEVWSTGRNELVIVASQGKGILTPAFFEAAKQIARGSGARTIRAHPLTPAIKRLHKRLGFDVSNDEYSELVL